MKKKKKRENEEAEEQQQIPSVYSHYTSQPALAGTSS